MTIDDFKTEINLYLEGNHPYEFGSFMTAVLANDLVGAFNRADGSSRINMHSFAMILYNDMPGRTKDPKKDWWGSYEAVKNRIYEQKVEHGRA